MLSKFIGVGVFTISKSKCGILQLSLVSKILPLSFLHNKPCMVPHLTLRMNTTALVEVAKGCYNKSRVGVTYDMGSRQAQYKHLKIASSYSFSSVLFSLALALLSMVKEETAQESIHWSNCFGKL